MYNIIFNIDLILVKLFHEYHIIKLESSDLILIFIILSFISIVFNSKLTHSKKKNLSIISLIITLSIMYYLILSFL